MSATGPDQALARQPGHGLSILVVEDHDATRDAVLALIADAFPGCHLAAATTAESAIDACAARVPQVVVMDIALPGMSGIEALRRIKGLYPRTLVVMHSANDMQVFRDEATSAGASAFVKKGRGSARLATVIAGLFPPGEHRLQAS